MSKCVKMFYFHIVILSCVSFKGLEGQLKLCDSPNHVSTKTDIAPLHSSIQLRLCLIANITRSKFSILRINNCWKGLNHNSQCQNFAWKKDSTKRNELILTITLRNVTVHEYGVNDIFVHTGSGETGSETLYFKWTINPTGNQNHTFEAKRSQTANEANDTITCNAAWYPKLIIISNNLTGKILNVVNNTIKQTEHRSLSYDIDEHGCSDITVFKCQVIDFRGTSYTKYLDFTNICLPKLCEGEHFMHSVNSTSGVAVNVTLCLVHNKQLGNQNINVSFSPKLNVAFGLKVIHTRNNIYNIILTLNNLTTKDSGVYTAKITMSYINKTLERKINMSLYDPPQLCETSSNNTVIQTELYGNLSISFCVLSNIPFQKQILVNKRVLDHRLSSTFYKKTLSTYIYNFTINLHNVSLLNATKYKVSLLTDLGFKFLYVFDLKINCSLDLCKNQESHVVARSRMGSQTVVHICLVSNLKINHIGIDSVVYDVNVENDTKLSVSLDRMYRQETSMHYSYIQIYFRNTSLFNNTKYNITVKPSEKCYKDFFLTLLQMDVPDFEDCWNQQLKTYYFLKVRSNVTIPFCIKKSQYSINSTGITLNVIGTEKGDNINVFLNKNEPNQYKIEIQFTNIKKDNFARYEVKVRLSGDIFIRNTFYLIQDKEVQKSVCKTDSANQVVSKGHIDNPADSTFCLKTFGTLDTSVIINNETFSISTNNNSRILVARKLDKGEGISYIQVQILDESQEKYILQIPSSSKVSTLQLAIFTKCASSVFIDCVNQTETNSTLTLCESVKISNNFQVSWEDRPIANNTKAERYYELKQHSRYKDWFQVILTLNKIDCQAQKNSTAKVVLRSQEVQVNVTIIKSSRQNDTVSKIFAKGTALKLLPLWVLLIVVPITGVLCYVCIFKTCKKYQLGKNKQGSDLNKTRLEAKYVNCHLTSHDGQLSFADVAQQGTVWFVDPFPDLTKDLYANIRQLPSDTILSSVDTPGACCFDGSSRQISNEGLVYVTLDHMSEGQSLQTSKSTQSDGSVIYASLNFKKMSRLALQVKE
ncbi:uncharacterized protein LOC106051064 isoform X2 [Biomphalaria glabrata]|uniref:Uncharacterized protein LOC106051064 isoform X2 n=1 Tax=Biomphalaria glabrata TaxID=6526 RepID=A0A9W2YU16_BIOGL|nr:uncharacterized protein LOC106051064 isoform X2 [Biomphalaria glabrata]